MRPASVTRIAQIPVMTTNLYELLGLQPKARLQDIQSAYRQQAGGERPAESQDATLRETQRAYRILTDPERRRAYDTRERRTRAEPLKVKQEHATEPTPSDSVYLERSFETYAPSFDELFDRFWSNFDLLTRPKAEHLESLTVEVTVTKTNALTGGRTRILIPARAKCPSCSGEGAVGTYECWQCSGQGSITAEYPLDVVYPAGMKNEHVVRIPLRQFGIRNFYLTIRFRLTEQ